MSDEILDLVSDLDEVIGTIPRKKTDQNYTKNFRVINAFLINKNQQIWAPVRHHNKLLFPKHFDCSIGGHVQTKETYLQALHRETKEEVNIDLNEFYYKEIAYFSPVIDNTSAFMKVYLILYNDEKVNFNPSDFTHGIWTQPKELLLNIQSGKKAKGDLEFILTSCF